ncbi:50S ribosomal protein L21 [Cardinium endosymbiont of Culicoides punctatus]|uniref:50S ribosomal protein L21 n=1 Tax=Cardinium endosymbiont of Culicoides punctatus TaxID=2304601 RepID=UPI0010583C5C|nr:50S ribosomal protein L21 [Cardinium endosymbiont of Culicoides punctatus]TDG94973.1 50S ribosomal protein L21 [Cardinium endosymbiont of Culicoides punctatus]
MYAIVEIAGKQFKVSKKQKLYTPKLQNEVGDALTFDKVLLLGDEQGAIAVGKPMLDGVTITAKVLDHTKGDKVIVFKKKRRKGYRVKRGHRQDHTQIIIEDIVK